MKIKLYNSHEKYLILNLKFAVEKKKEAIESVLLDKNVKKKIEREEERLKNNNKDLTMVKMKSMFAIGFAFTALLSMFNTMWVFIYLQYGIAHDPV